MIRDRIYIQELDGLRFVAFLLIFIHHSSLEQIPVFKELKSIGWLGVEIFFCLSAFLLTRLLLLEIQRYGKVSLFKFFVRRTLRIWPLYFSYVTIAIAISFCLQENDLSTWHRVLGLITFTDNFFTAFNGFNPILFTAHLWTISYEEQFYLILPFTVLWLRSLNPVRSVYVFIIVFVVGTLFRFLVISKGVAGTFIWVLPFTHFDSILAGIIFGFYEQKFIKLNKKLVLTALVLSLLSIFWLPDTNMIAYHLLAVYPLAGILALAVVCYLMNSDTRWIKRLMGNNTISFLGKISFGLYVFHIICIRFVDHAFGISHPLMNFVSSFFIVVVVASASFMVLEKRFLALKTRFTQRRE